MKLSTRVLSSTLAITGSFAVLILVLLFQYSSSVAIASQYSEQTQPAREAIEHLLTTVYDDFLLVEQYLLVTDYSSLSQFDSLLSHSQEQCEILTDEVDNLITLKELTNQEVIESYNTAVLVYSSWERSRDSLLQLHKEYLATDNISQSEILGEKARFVQLMQNSTSLFAQSLEQLNDQQLSIQQELSQKTKTVQWLLIALLVTFLVISIVSSYLLIKRLTTPLDEMSKISTEFTKGDYKARVNESSPVAELRSLQQQLNRVYSLVDKTFTTDKEKDKAAQHLLPSQYKDILDFIHTSALQGRMPTIKDVKKHFSLTHPTVISRLNYLKENGYIELKKQGRNKCIVEI